MSTLPPDTLLLSHSSAGVSFQMLNSSKTLNCVHVLSFSAVVPIVPVVIPLAIDRNFMVTPSPPLINEIGNITERGLRLQETSPENCLATATSFN